MHSKWVFNHFDYRSKGSVLSAVMLWISGIVTGIVLCLVNSHIAVNTLNDSISSSPKPYGLFLICVLPIVFVLLSRTRLLFALVYFMMFLVAISYGFCGMGIYVSLRSAAWLLKPMLLFSASCSSVLMWWLLLQVKMRQGFCRSVCLTAALSGLVFIADFFLVSPFVGDLAKLLLEGFA